MLEVHPTPLRYERRHHWRWLVRRMFPAVLRLAIWSAAIGFILSRPGMQYGIPAEVFAILVILFLLVLLESLGLLFIYYDWRTRTIRLFADGRLDYEYGIFVRKGIGISARFGALRYNFNDFLGRFLDCADLILPFDGGVIKDIPSFHFFWEVAQGRI